MDVFDVFEQTQYTFLQVARAKVRGNTIVSESNHMGVFKLRNGMIASNNQETRQSEATLHIKPNENFISDLNAQLVGHGIRYGGQVYEIIGQTGGMNFDSGVMEHYRVTLQVSKLIEGDVSS